MKTILITIFIILSLDLFCQIDPRENWSKSIQEQFASIKEKKIDTVLLYYEYLGPWTNLPDSCNDIPKIWVMWKEDNGFFYRELSCDSINNIDQKLPNKTWYYFLKYQKELKSKNEDLHKNTTLPPIQSDGKVEYLVLMTSNENVVMNISDYQRENEEWNSLKSII